MPVFNMQASIQDFGHTFKKVYFSMIIEIPLVSDGLLPKD